LQPNLIYQPGYSKSVISGSFISDISSITSYDLCAGINTQTTGAIAMMALWGRRFLLKYQNETFFWRWFKYGIFDL